MPAFRCIPAVSFRALLLVVVALSATTTQAADCPASLPDTMRAIRLHAPGGPESLVLDTIPRPAPAAGEVLVRVHAAAVNPVDWKLQQAGRLRHPAVPGGDLAGTIVAVGAGVDGWQCGDAVLATVDQVAQQGSYAEYVAVRPDQMLRKSAALGFDEAAGVPTAGIAAWRYLLAAGQVAAGDRVLIHGAAGGVGSMAVQLAKARGAYVIATASTRNHAYLRELGADETIDYTTTRFEDVARDIDLVFSTVAGDTLDRSVAVLRDGGRLVTATGTLPREACEAGRITCPPAPGWEVAAGFAALAPYLENGSLRVNVERVFPLEQAGDAQELSRAGHVRGKLVLQVVPDTATR